MSAKTILIVDDDRIFAKALGRTLENESYTTLVSHDTQGALLHAREAAVDCAIIDYNLGAMLGTTLMERLRAEGFEFPVIVLTGFGDVPTATMVMKLGAADFSPRLSKVQLPSHVRSRAPRRASARRDKGCAYSPRAKAKSLTPSSPAAPPSRSPRCLASASARWTRTAPPSSRSWRFPMRPS